MCRHGRRTDSGSFALGALRGRSPQGTARGFRRSVWPERGAQGSRPQEPLAEGHACASPTSSADAGDSPAFVGLCSWKERRLLSSVGTAERKSPALCLGLGTAPGGSCGRSALLNGRCGERPGAEAAAVPPWGGRKAAGCSEAAAAISRRTVPPMESTWNSPGRRGRAGKCSVSERHCRDEAGLRPPLPGRGRGASEGLGRHGPRYRLPRGGCAARSRVGGETRARRALSCISSGRSFR